MGFRPLGMDSYGTRYEALLMPEGAAEYLWSIFISIYASSQSAAEPLIRVASGIRIPMKRGESPTVV